MASPSQPALDIKSRQLSSRGRSSTQREKILTDREYADRVKSYARTQQGQHYHILANYLFAPYQRNVGDIKAKQVSQTAGAKDAECFVIIHVLHEQSPPQSYHVFNPSDLANAPIESENSNTLVFLRGHQPPPILNAIGAKYRIDPEFFRQHLDLGTQTEQSIKGNYTCLPSTYGNILRLPCTTVGSRFASSGLPQSHSHYHNKLSKMRSDVARRLDDHVNAYIQARESHLLHGTSIVRDFTVHNHRHFSLEQDIAVYVATTGKRWVGIVWLDTGRDLNQDNSGPWQPKALQCESEEIQFHLTIRHGPGAALDRQHLTRSDTFPQTPSGPHGKEPSRLLQTSARLHKNYGEVLDNATMSMDPFYALSDVFSFVAVAEAQFLDTLQLSLDCEIDIPLLSRYSSQSNAALGNLVYNKKRLTVHLRRLQDITSFLENRTKIVDWPNAHTPTTQQISARAAEKLRMDYNYLVERAKALSCSFDNAMDVLQNNTILKESQKAIEQAEGVAKLTRLAFFFIPLSLTSSIFGMNIKQFTNGALMSIWVWVVTSSVTLIFSYLVLSWSAWHRNDVLTQRKWRKDRKKKADVEAHAFELNSGPSSIPVPTYQSQLIR